MKIMSRQLTIDLYNCSEKKLKDLDEIKNKIKEVIAGEIKLAAEKISEKHMAIIGAFDEGHIAVHIYNDLRYVAADVFTCSEDTEPEELSKELRKYFKPDKTKSTYLKRGDFGQEREIKPKIKTKTAPLRKIQTTGAKVIKKLVHSNK